MLVLSRKINEAICIGENIQLIPLSIKGGKVHIGVMAPDGVVVHRFEVSKRASKTTPDGVVPVAKASLRAS